MPRADTYSIDAAASRVPHKPTSRSPFAMLRGAIALAWVDGRLSEGEREQLRVYIENNARLNEAQRAQLLQEMTHKVSLGSIWDDITDKQDRAHLIDIAETIFTRDGDYSPEEKAMFERMFEAHMAMIDTEAVEADITEMQSRQRQEHAQEAQEVTGQMGLFGRLLYYLDEKLGV